VSINYPSLFVISPLVILSEAKNLISLRVNSVKNLMVPRAGSVRGANLAHALTLG